MNTAMPRPRIYPKHKANERNAPYDKCGVCTKPYDGSSDSVSYFSAQGLMKAAHVACVPELDLTGATTFNPAQIPGRRAELDAAGLGGDGIVELDADLMIDGIMGGLD